ncbi:MAG: O-methyltransferase [Bacteroidia bacterium]|nr:O-methyltransferase [Bacteroidia bacterium]MDW8158396.1 O-methyltransferase [Bacteroidia bacterium]
MNFVPIEIQEYAEKHSEPESELLYALRRETYLKTMYPRMLSGHLQGRLLSFISRLVAPSCILEIGTFTGYATLCLAEGLLPGGKIYTIDNDPEVVEIALGYFEKAQLQHCIEVLIGEALSLIPEIPVTFDLVFLDAQKEEYLTYYHLVLPKLRQGGVIIADNVLWSGNVLDTSTTDPATKGLQQFNTFIKEDSRVFALLLPVRDGLFFIQKK